MADLTMQIRNLREQLSQELEGNFRLRLGLIAILLLFLIWISLVWSDLNRSLYEQVNEQESLVAELRELEAIDVWQQRLDRVVAAETALTEKLWQGESVGLVQARIQAALDAAIVREDFVRQTVNIGVPQPVENLDGLRRLRIRLATSLTPLQLRDSLINIENSSSRLWIERLEIRRTGVRWNVEIMLVAHFSQVTVQ